MKFTVALGLLFLTSGFVYAKNLDQCQELLNQIENGNRLVNCENNEEGNITYLVITNYDDPNKIPNNDYDFEYLNNLKNLKDLEQLHIFHDIPENTCITNCTRNYIETSTIKDLKNLKLLDIYGVKLSQDNIDDISTMENLESLELDFCSFENVKDFSSLSNLNVSFLSSLQTLNGKVINNVPVEFVYQFKNLKGLYLDYCPSLNLKQFTDVEDLWIGYEENVNDLKDFKNLRSLRISSNNDLSVLEQIESLNGLDIYKDLPIDDFDEYPYQDINFTLPENSKITVISLRNVRVTNEDVDKFLNLKELQRLHFTHCDFSSLSDENYNILKELGNRIFIGYYSCSFKDGMEPLNGWDDSTTTVTDYPTDYYYNDIDPEPTNYYTEYDEATDIVEIYYYPENDEPTDY